MENRQHFQESIVRHVFNHLTQVSVPTRRHFLKVISNIRVHGFRDILKAPLSLRIEAVTKLAPRNPIITKALLNCWVETQKELQATVNNYLASQQNQILEPEEFLAEFCTLYPSFEATDAQVMLKYLQDTPKPFNFDKFMNESNEVHQPNQVLEGSPTDSGVTPNSDFASSFDLTCLYGQWLEKLRSVPSDSVEWEGIPAFLEAVRLLAEEKRQEREHSIGLTQLWQAMTNLKGAFLEELVYFDSTNIHIWQPEICPPNQVGEVCERLGQLQVTIGMYREVKKQTPLNRSEEKRKLQEMEALADRIETELELISKALVPHSTKQLPPMQMNSINSECVESSSREIGPVDHKVWIVEPTEKNFQGSVESTPNSQGHEAQTKPVVTSVNSFVPPDSEENDQENKYPEEKIQPNTQTQLGSDGEPNVLDNSEARVDFPVPPIIPTVVAEDSDLLAGETSNLPTEVEPTPKSDTENELTSQARPLPTVILQSPVESELDSYYRFLPPIPRPGTNPTPSGIFDTTHQTLVKLVWRFLHEGKFGIAYHVARAIECQPENQPHLPSWLLRAVYLGRFVHFVNGDLARILREDFEQYSETCYMPGFPEWNQAISLLLATAALRSALLAPDTNAPAILHAADLPGELNQTIGFCRRVSEYGEKLYPLDLLALRDFEVSPEGTNDVAPLLQEVKKWFNEAPQLNLIAKPVKKVWCQWLEKDGPIHDLLRPVMSNDTTKLQKVKISINRLSDYDKIKQEAKDNRFIRRNPINEKTDIAMGLLCHHSSKAVELARQWVAWNEPHHPHKLEFHHVQAQDLRQDLCRRQSEVHRELENFAKNHPSHLLQVGVACLMAAVKDLVQMFALQDSIPFIEPPVRFLLGADLLRLPSVLTDEEWNPICSKNSLIQTILSTSSADEPAWEEVFTDWSNQGNHEMTGRVIDWLEFSKLETTSIVEAFRERRNLDLQRRREMLQSEVDAAGQTMERYIMFGLLNPTNRLRYQARLTAIQDGLEETLVFGKKQGELQDFWAEINTRRQEQLEHIQHRLNSEQVRGLMKTQPKTYERIEACIKNDDVLTANEYIDLAMQGDILPGPDNQTSSFANFFPEVYEKLEDFLEPAYGGWPDPLHIVREIRSLAKGKKGGFSIGPISMQGVGGPQAIQAADMVEHWFRLKKSHKPEPASVEFILKGMGFNPIEINIKPTGRLVWIEVKTELISDREFCPIPFYGSNANGHYQILCIWGRPTLDTMVTDIGMTFRAAPTLVFYFGRLKEQRRRDLAKICRSRLSTFLVIDDILILCMCGERGSRLPLLFQNTLPFTFCEPYTTKAGTVPPEMFYGREREKRDIVEPEGSCFIYGGRQLGKTALLRAVERENHDPKLQKYAKWIDLKAEGIGFDLRISDIWHLLIREFKKFGAVQAALPENTGSKTLVDQVRNWLNEDHQRRILLLLDEADRFLESDGKQDFIQLNVLNGLMTQTNGRFKCVFAGLHNVLRTTTSSNNSLAHFGTGRGGAICIGPLLDNGEFRKAIALIKRPFASLGYSFESDDLITRILSQTNYYPSLIQLYCIQLLRHIGRFTTVQKDAPPFIIQARQVDEVYHSQGLQVDIRARFRMTLELDQRYEVIAYAIAHDSILDPDRAFVDGFTISSIRKEALRWWPQGFRDNTTDASIRYLLEEMVGLGVLRVVEGKGNCFALRSPNVALLMGNDEEIESVLLKNREVPIIYEPSTFRSAYRHGEGKKTSQRNPLTAQQEAELRSRRHGISVLFGCNAAGLDQLEKFLTNDTFRKEFFLKIDTAQDSVAFVKQLSLIKERQNPGTILVFVSPECPWGDSWVSEAIRKTRKLTSGNTYVRFLFVADPDTAWSLTNPNDSLLEAFGKDISTLNLLPWHDAALRQWMDECDFTANDEETRAQICAVTGNWPILLDEFYRRSKAEAHHSQWKRHLQELAADLSSPALARQYLTSFGLKDSNPMVMLVLKTLADLGSATEAELVTYHDQLPPEEVSHVLRWGELLSLVRQIGDETWEVDNTLAQLLAVLVE